MKRAEHSTRKQRVHDGASARDTAANAASSSINLGVILGWLPHVAAAASAILSIAQFFNMARRWRKKRRKQRKPRKQRVRK